VTDGDIKAVSLAAFVIALALLVWIFVRFDRRRLEKEDVTRKAEREARQAAIDAGVRDGTLTPDGLPVCAIEGCSNGAEHATPRTGGMWLDGVPGLRLLNELTAMPARYKVQRDPSGKPRLCAVHDRVAVDTLRHEHARMRSEHAAFNAEQRHALDWLEQGGLEEMVSRKAVAIRQKLGYRFQRPELVSNTEAEAVHVLTRGEETGT